MERLNVLIVEDEVFATIDLIDAIHSITPAAVVTKASVADTKSVLHLPFDFAFLDVDVTNGKTFEVAHMLGEKQTPFAFVSGSSPKDMPAELRDVPFISKPFDRSLIERLLPRAKTAD
jgi:hypothetical protein